MRSEAIVMTPRKFAAWVKVAKQGPSAGAGGKAAFVTNGCSGCHTFKPAGATGKIGPDLDNLPQYAKKAGKPLQAFIRESIVNPNAYIAPGYSPNVMPSTFSTLPKSQLDALVAFLSGSGKKGGK
jgi:cytochrome c oxidase subunit 2